MVEKTSHLGEYLNHKETVGRTMEGTADQNEGRVTRNHGKGDPCYTVVKSSEEMCPIVNVESSSCKL